ncbi:hypothetical protein VOLCADRAFT_94528 [Volvox carteri f. nagariensis]|uniref:Uncharacterized protein n=1 Tax=Volvox carteri f. nagariensis TaxID=3068 RepID=D8U511_VOLCA|nr:uncharacterized protein VOLCADRAFT_94528 [Volvox carteri f. nagariensis]EFJ45136.1 hypothetical protein VOLCADRAFT_94528 [Volvox carteri f. nagariensis]|eukprot:XP_002953812.1 hypothetical protein VOLCADRAFT_94528 [Volvox carteri f. nagariensis]
MSFSFRQTIPTTRASKDDNLFAGKSVLRADEKKKTDAAPKNSALQAYLAKNYACGDSGDGAQAMKRKKKKKAAPEAGGAVRIVDQDVSGFNTVDPTGRGTLTGKRTNVGEEDTEDDEAPTIANPEEAAALIKQIEKVKTGSGWVSAAETHARLPAGPGRRSTSPDASPPRRRQRHDSPDASPPRRGTIQDASPPRRGTIQDASPPRRRQRQDSPDASPPRRRQRHDSPDASPPRRGTVQDASPPRRRQRRDSPDASPLRRGAVQDASPPRRRQRHDSLDASPPRRGTVQDASPPRRRQRHDSPDASPLRRGAVQDASPPRRRQRHDSPDASPPRRPPGPGPSSGAGPPARMGDGTAAGLVTATQLAADIQKQRQEAEERRRNAEGRGAQTVYRDKATGRVMTAEEARQAKEDERAARRKPSIYDEDQTLEWRAGLAQKRQAEERMRDMQEEASKPFARGDVDSSHDAALRNQVRFGDPFAHLARRKQSAAAAAAADAPLTERYDLDKLNKSGFKIPQEVPVHSWLKRGVAAPANRYNIRPGRHWDGVNRSNGFEAELFKHQNARAAKELEARLWSMGDM